MQAQVVFDSTSSEAGWLLWYSTVLLFGGLLVLFGLGIAARTWGKGWGARLFGIALTLVLILRVWLGYSFDRWKYFTQYRDSGPYQTFECPVKNYLAPQGRVVNFEQFTVSGVLLGYGSLGLPRCYHRPAANGGPIHEGLPVRISYNGNCIVKVEILKEEPAK